MRIADLLPFKWYLVVVSPSCRTSAKTIRRAHAVQPVAAVQTEYSFMERDVEKNGVIQTCEDLGIGFVPWAPVEWVISLGE